MRLYKYVMHNHESDVVLAIQTVFVVKETPCGYRYIPSWLEYKFESQGLEGVKKQSKWVSKTGTSRKWHRTKDSAMDSYVHRSKHRLMHAKRNLKLAEYAVQLSGKKLIIQKNEGDCYVLD